jgi:hypothetical protein
LGGATRAVARGAGGGRPGGGGAGGGGRAFSTKGGGGQGRRQGEWRVGGGVVGGVCAKNLKRKKRSSKFFRTGILEVGLRTPFGGRKIHKFALGAEMASYGPAPP